VLIGAIPPHEHGRALSMWESVQCAAFAAPTVITGSLVALVGLRVVLACCSSTAAAIAALAAAAGALRPARHSDVTTRTEPRDRLRESHMIAGQQRIPPAASDPCQARKQET
jgi:hypothetical protein